MYTQIICNCLRENDPCAWGTRMSHGSHSVTFQPAQMTSPSYLSPLKLVLDLATTEGYKAELI